MNTHERQFFTYVLENLNNKLNWYSDWRTKYLLTNSNHFLFNSTKLVAPNFSKTTIRRFEKWLKREFNSKVVKRSKNKCATVSNKTQSKMELSLGTCFGLLYFFMLANVSTGKWILIFIIFRRHLHYLKTFVRKMTEFSIMDWWHI